MSEVRIATEPRNEFGKGASRRLRRNQQVPGVVYGHGTDPVHISLPGRELTRALSTSGVLLELELAIQLAELLLERARHAGVRSLGLGEVDVELGLELRSSHVGVKVGGFR